VPAIWVAVEINIHVEVEQWCVNDGFHSSYCISNPQISRDNSKENGIG
jgi:hypothetical protein